MIRGACRIEVKDGRAYLYQEYKVGGYVFAGHSPLGNDPKFIKKIIDHYKCKIVFL